MRPYELGFILHPQVEQPDVTQAVDRVSQYVTATGGEVTSVDVWGRRALAYPIRKQQEGTYVFCNAQLQPQAIQDLERNLKLDEEVLRYLVLRLED
jgi:small subunit ribosomal protein S6